MNCSDHTFCTSTSKCQTKAKCHVTCKPAATVPPHVTVRWPIISKHHRTGSWDCSRVYMPFGTLSQLVNITSFWMPMDYARSNIEKCVYVIVTRPVCCNIFMFVSSNNVPCMLQQHVPNAVVTCFVWSSYVPSTFSQRAPSDVVGTCPIRYGNIPRYP